MDILLYMSRIANSKQKPTKLQEAVSRRQFGYEIDFETLEEELSDSETLAKSQLASPTNSRTQKSLTFPAKCTERFFPSNLDPESVENVFAAALNVDSKVRAEDERQKF